jgi:hypothetical protein
VWIAPPSPPPYARSSHCWPRGFATPTGVRLHTLADVLAYAAAEGLAVRLDGNEIQVRRPKANRPGRRAFVSGRRKQNTIKATVASDARGRPMWSGAVRPGRMHDQTAVKTEGIDEPIEQYPDVKVLVDSGYRGLANDHPDQVIAPPASRGRTAQPTRSQPTKQRVKPSPRNASRPNTPSPDQVVATTPAIHRPPRRTTRHHPRVTGLAAGRAAEW